MDSELNRQVPASTLWQSLCGRYLLPVRRVVAGPVLHGRHQLLPVLRGLRRFRLSLKRARMRLPSARCPRLTSWRPCCHACAANASFTHTRVLTCSVAGAAGSASNGMWQATNEAALSMGSAAKASSIPAGQPGVRVPSCTRQRTRRTGKTGTSCARHCAMRRLPVDAHSANEILMLGSWPRHARSLCVDCPNLDSGFGPKYL